MKRHNVIQHGAALLLLGLAILFASCENIMEPPFMPESPTDSDPALPSVEQEKARITFKLSGATARTVLPDVNIELRYILTGGIIGKDISLNEEFSDDGITLDLEPGAWSFTLNAFNAEGDIVLTDDTEAVLAAAEVNEVIFILEPLREGEGAVNIRFEYPENSVITGVKTGGEIEAQTVTGLGGSAAWVYQAAGVEAGDYFATFSFYRGDELAAVVSETIQVRSGLTSKKTITLSPDDLKVPVLEITAIESGWNPGSIVAGGENWFSFTASATDRYIHVKFGTRTDLFVRVYDRAFEQVGSGSYLYDSMYYRVLSDFDIDQTYYIMVEPDYSNYSGSYEIAVGSVMPPGTVPTTILTSGWNSGSIARGGEQWFKFRPNAANKYVHVKFDTLEGLYMDVYDSSFEEVESDNLSSKQGNTASMVLSGLDTKQEYYINVWPYYSFDFGNYEIGVNSSIMPPGIATTDITSVWQESYIAEGGEQWFKLNPEAASQHIHFKFGSLTSLNMQAFDSAGQLVRMGGNGTLMNREFYWLSGGTDDTSYLSLRDLAAGQTYYIKVWPETESGTGSGSFDIIRTGSILPPGTASPDLAPGWNSGNIEAGGEQWFTFTPAAANQYLHIKFGRLEWLYIQVYTAMGSVAGTLEDIAGEMGNTSSIALSGLDTKQKYYIKVWPFRAGYSGSYEIAIDGSTTPPGVVSTTLTSDWKESNIAVGGEQWFELTQGATNRYLHVRLGTLTNYMSVDVYTSAFSRVLEFGSHLAGSPGDIRSIALSRLDPSRMYYVVVRSYNYSGSYDIAVNGSGIPPETDITLASGWNQGYITQYGVQYFAFTPASANQYIHVQNSTVGNLYVNVYDSAMRPIGGSSDLLSGGPRYKALSGLDTTQTYYIRVSFYDYNSGSYEIAVTNSTAPPQ